MRGKAVLFRMFHGGDGITPAHAGKRKPTLPAERQTRDHPRACGEKKRSQSQPGRLRGSPPRMRGKAALGYLRCALPRITPAHAGKRQSASYPQQRPRDHPRACGEKLVQLKLRAAIQGSPPRMRGKVLSPRSKACCGGITPAHAGKSGKKIKPGPDGRDHPRACGEKPCDDVIVDAKLGSPPRMRGKGWAGSPRGSISGITPAHAGKSLFDFCKSGH